MTSKTGRASFSASTSALLAVPYSVTPGESRNFDLTTSSHVISSGTTTDPAYLFSQLKSAEWIHRYGLKSQKLTFDQILQQIGFKRVESFDPVIGKTISAKYAGNLYHEVQHDNGDRYVLTCRPEKLREYHHRLTRMLNLLRKRLLFITNGSRRLFGIIGEPSVCLICDCKTFDHRIFNQFQSALTSLFKEQISKIKRFNIIWVSNDNQQFREQPIDVGASNIDQAIDWICDQKCPRNKISISSTCEAVLQAFNNNVHSIYLITEGDSSDLAREMLRDNIVKTRLSSSSSIPFHVVSLFCQNNDTQTFLRSIAQSADGSYFCYKIKDEISDLKAPSNLTDPTRIKLQDDKLQVGTNAIPDYPLDIALMYKEIIQCQSIIDRIEKILGFIRDENQSPLQSFETAKSLDAFNVSGENNFQRSMIVQSSTLFNNEENDMPSEDWLKIYGMDAQKLDFFSVLQSAAFRHCDGVVTLLKPPDDTPDKTDKTPANPQDKLINAIYCDQFAHVAWPDGTIRHVHVTPELHRDYERRIKTLLEKIKSRLAYLKKGSREVFGTILENNIYILIDTSKSMQHHLGFVKEKLRLLIQDQLFAKERVNLVAFNSIINPWRDRLTKMSDSTTYSQLQPWIDGLNAEGTTNTLAALRFALADPATEAIYLLTDGRPDQNERHILSQVQYRQTVPIHTIAFNCQDQTANQFLYDLAKQTGGRFHAFKYGFEKESSIEIPESEDVGNLKRELIRGEKELQRIAALRDECLGKAWALENIPPKNSKYKTRQNNQNSAATAHLKSHSTLDIAFRPSSASMPQRTSKKKRSTLNQKIERRSKSATNITEHHSVLNINSDQYLLHETREYLHLYDHNDQTKSDTEHDQPIAPDTTPIKKKKTPFNEVKSYLKKNSLVSKGLTIFDVLYPTTVTVKEPRHIQVIDRYVLAKVWDEILPLAYGSYIGRLRLVNHYAVDLEKYEIKLKELIAEYHRFTTNFIWKHLSEDDKRKWGQSLYWNSLSKDEQTRITQEITREEYTSQSVLESFAWRKLTDDEQNSWLQKPPIYQDDNQNLLKKSLKDAELESALKGVERMDVEIHRAIKFLQISTDLRQLQKRADADAKPEVEPVKKVITTKPPINRSSGQRVVCRFDPDGFFYSGIIKKGSTGVSIIHFDMGIEQDATGHIILPMSGAIAQPNLFIDDRVLVRQMNEREEFWAPGIIIVLPSPAARPPSLYMVQIYTPAPRDVHVHRRDLLKISRVLFERTILYLQSINRRYIPRPGPSSNNLGPLSDKVDQLYIIHNKHYQSLKLKLKEQMELIIRLERERRPPKSLNNEYSQTNEESITPKPDIPSPPPTQEYRIPPNTKVCARWPDSDGFFYAGTVIERNPTKSNSYIVKRNKFSRIQSAISQDDIFLESQLTPIGKMKPKSCALIKCQTRLRDCCRPAVILEADKTNSQVNILFYDCDPNDRQRPNDDYVIPISQEQFQSYTTYRINYEKHLVAQAIVGLNKKARTFMLGIINSRTKCGYKHNIEWYNEETDIVEEEYLFGAFNYIKDRYVDDYVLAIVDDEKIFKPAIITEISDDRKTLTVQFLPPNKHSKPVSVESKTTFLINELYYESIKNLIA